MTNHSSRTRPDQAWIVLSSTYQSPSTKSHDHGVVISKPKCAIAGESQPLVVTNSHQLVLEALERYRKEMTSRAETAQYAVCLWRGTNDGVDVVFTPETSGLRTEVRLRVRSVNVIVEGEGVVGGEMLGDDVDGDDDDEEEEEEEGKDHNGGVEGAICRSPWPEGHGYCRAGTRLWLHTLSRRWSVDEGEEGGEAVDRSTSLIASGRYGITVLPRKFAGGSVDGNLTTTRLRW